MNVTYTDKAKQVPEEYALLQRATAYLEEVAGSSGAGVTVSWDRSDSGHRYRYLLRLSDFTGEASETFFPSELWSSKRMRWPLLRLWGDLLQIRSHKLMDKLIGVGEPAEG
jgi:hypothetical protein